MLKIATLVVAGVFVCNAKEVITLHLEEPSHTNLQDAEFARKVHEIVKMQDQQMAMLQKLHSSSGFLKTNPDYPAAEENTFQAQKPDVVNINFEMPAHPSSNFISTTGPQQTDASNEIDSIADDANHVVQIPSSTHQSKGNSDIMKKSKSAISKAIHAGLEMQEPRSNTEKRFLEQLRGAIAGGSSSFFSSAKMGPQVNVLYEFESPSEQSMYELMNDEITHGQE